MSSQKNRRERIDIVLAEFARQGVRNWRQRTANSTHVLFEFEHGGRWHSFTHGEILRSIERGEIRP
jgi:hypothetical protein